MTSFLRRFRQVEDGAAALEFVLLFPFVFGMVLGSVELGILLMRQVMLERGLDLTVREVRLDSDGGYTHDEIKQQICKQAEIISDCHNQIRLEMIPVDPRNWATLDAEVRCVDRASTGTPVQRFRAGTSNQLVMLRACVLIDPYFPANILGFPNITNGDGSAFALVATSAFVVEPS